MIIIGLEDCLTCKLLKDKYPSLRYIELSRRRVKSSKEILDIKSLLKELKVYWFPVLLNDYLDEIIPIKTLDKEFSLQHPKLY